MIKTSILLASLLASPLVHAEHPACIELPYDFTPISHLDLRDIAASCSHPAFQSLNYHRAYYQELQGAFSAYANMGFTSTTLRKSPHRYGRVYGMYVQLSEILVSHAGGTASQQAALLNRVYEDANEIAELRLKGYHNRADWLESHRQRDAYDG